MVLIFQTYVVVFFSFFFFQAEDGIRDIGVTGVQTCALPIFFLASGVLTGRTRAPLRRCRDQDLAHVHRLRITIERLGGIPPHAPDPSGIPSLTDATTESAALDFATALEEQTIGAYMATMRLIYRRPLVRTIGSVMASDAQQLVVLRQLAGTPPVPSPFENGSPP